jgi:hypothetical protein
MGKIGKNQNGFSAIEVLLILVILGIVGFIGYFVLHAKHNTDKSLTSNHSTTPVIKKKTATTTPASASMYQGWKDYCESTTSGCFKYPSSWTAPGPNNDNVAFVQNPEETVNVAYAKINDTNGLGDFLTTSITPLSSSNTYSVVGGYYTINNGPGYYVIDSSRVSNYGLSVGKKSHLGEGQGLYFTKNGATLTFTAGMNMKGGVPSVNISQTNAWLNSTDGTNANLIAQSFEFK